ncbi:MAG: PHP domain-containing protein, partial [Sedimentisphaerales bacterium]|nr:PHP domain-containing protein [Sedimentisphaerales bacterium]
PNVCSDSVQVDLRVVPSKSTGAAWQYFTGSKYHNVRLREIAAKKKLKLNEYGLFRGEKQLAGKTEQDVYKKLGLAYIPPTLREDRGEVELAQKNKLPAVVEQKNIRGDLHMHTPASDGRNTLEELTAMAQMLGYQYIAVTDHSQSSAIANGLDIERLLEHIKKIKALNEQYDDITILTSSEVDILMDGSMDYPDDVLAQLDFVIGSVHSGMAGPEEKCTARVIRAMKNPYVNCIGHPTGRLIGTREPMKLDMNAVIAAAVETHTALEINAHPMRLDLKDIHIRLAIEAGVKLIINTDAHDVAGLQLMRYGVATAQRGWATSSDILNCQPLDTIRAWRAKGRK